MKKINNGDVLQDGAVKEIIKGEAKALYGKTAKQLKKLGLAIEVSKRVVDNRELEGIDFSKFHYDGGLTVSLYDISRKTRFVVFEEKPNEITVDPYGFSNEHTFNLKKNQAIQNMRNYLADVIADGGDIAGVSHASKYITNHSRMSTVAPKF